MDNEEFEEEEYESIYENGHWEWDNYLECLKFVSDLPSPVYSFTAASVILGAVEFKDDLDLNEQQKFKRRYQRKGIEDDVVILQDIRDLVLFTAPKNILTHELINILHMTATDRFIRTLILYTQYFIQISDTMAHRTIELDKKVPTDRSKEIEDEFRENLNDLRILVAKEYASFIQGYEYDKKRNGQNTKTPFHMNQLLFETVLLVFIQIVWIALARPSYNIIELEINRLFKSDVYNMIERKLFGNSRANLTKREIDVLYGKCIKKTRKLKINSPLMNVYEWDRNTDYELYGLGKMIYPRLSDRLKYLEKILVAPEEKFHNYGISLGIIGKRGNIFDTTLREIKAAPSASKSTIQKSTVCRTSSKSISAKSKKSSALMHIIESLYIPERSESDVIPKECPLKMHPVDKKRNDQYKWKWHRYLLKMKIRPTAKSPKFKNKVKSVKTL